MHPDPPSFQGFLLFVTGTPGGVSEGCKLSHFHQHLWWGTADAEIKPLPPPHSAWWESRAIKGSLFQSL